MQRLDLSQVVPKAAGTFDRSVTPAQTSALIPGLRARHHITRLADLTHLDRSGIPVVCAIVPQSPDHLSVYTGKGVSREQARVGAVMEAVERQTAARPRLRVRRLCLHGRQDALDAGELGLRHAWHNRPIAVVDGYDIIRDEPVYVPLASVQCPWNGANLFAVNTSNGLASGNTLLEAVYHGLFELVERHVWSIAHVRGHLVPQLFIKSFIGAQDVPLPGTFVDDPVGSRIILPTGFRQIDGLLGRLQSADLSVQLTAVAESGLPLTLFACISDRRAQHAVAHMGLGCSWSPEHAAVRALTEAVQSRLVDIQGAREDVQRESDPPSRFGDHGRRSSRLPLGRWYYDAPAASVRLADLTDRSSDDLGEELRRLCQALHLSGIDRIAIVDLTLPESPVHVVRVIAPRLETFMLDQRVGPTIGKMLAPYRKKPKRRARNRE